MDSGLYFVVYLFIKYYFHLFIHVFVFWKIIYDFRRFIVVRKDCQRAQVLLNIAIAFWNAPFDFRQQDRYEDAEIYRSLNTQQGMQQQRQIDESDEPAQEAVEEVNSRTR